MADARRRAAWILVLTALCAAVSCGEAPPTGVRLSVSYARVPDHLTLTGRGAEGRTYGPTTLPEGGGTLAEVSETVTLRVSPALGGTSLHIEVVGRSRAGDPLARASVEVALARGRLVDAQVFLDALSSGPAGRPDPIAGGQTDGVAMEAGTSDPVVEWEDGPGDIPVPSSPDSPPLDAGAPDDAHLDTDAATPKAQDAARPPDADSPASREEGGSPATQDAASDARTVDARLDADTADAGLPDAERPDAAEAGPPDADASSDGGEQEDCPEICFPSLDPDCDISEVLKCRRGNGSSGAGR